jgi:cytochrome c oxidase subunit 2
MALALPIAVVAGLGLGGCTTGPLSTLEPSGPGAESIARLWWVMLGGSGALFVLVLGLFALGFLRPGWGTSMSPHRWIVLGGLVLPAVVLLPLLAYALVAGERLLPLPGVDPARIEVHAARWHWNFRYPEHGGVTTVNRLHLPAGAPIDVVVTSDDVIHSFWVPRLAGKIDAIPGHANVWRIRADVPGEYEGLCAEFCGVGHAAMRFHVVVHAADDYDAALARAASGADESP